MNRRVLETSYGPQIRFNDWSAEGAELVSAGGAAQLFAEGRATARWNFYPLGGGGDVALSLEFHFGRLGADGEFAVHFNAGRDGSREKGLAVVWRQGEVRAFHRDGQLAERAVPQADPRAPHSVRLATLGDRFEIAADGQPLAEGRFERGSGDNEGYLVLVLDDADVSITALTEQFIAHENAPPAWTKAELLYEEAFGEDSLAENWVCNGEPPACEEHAFTFRHMSVNVLRERFEGPIAMECMAVPGPTPDFMAGITDAIFIWMIDRPEGDLFDYMRGLPDAQLGNYTPLPLYWVDFGGTNNQTTRLRRNPGRHLIRQFTDRPRLLERDRAYRITTVQNGDAIEFGVDDEPWIVARDPDPLTCGHMGFRAFVADLKVSELKVWRIQ